MTQLKQFILEYWHGKKPLWKAYWLIGILGTLLFGAVLKFEPGNPEPNLVQVTLPFVLWVLFLAYIPWSAVAIWRCAENTSHRAWKYLARAITVLGVVGFCINIGENYSNTVGHQEALRPVNYKDALDSLRTASEKAGSEEGIMNSPSVKRDFYSKYPGFDNPRDREVVSVTVEVVAKELGKTRWDEELRDKTAERVKGILSASDAVAARYKQQ